MTVAAHHSRMVELLTRTASFSAGVLVAGAVAGCGASSDAPTDAGTTLDGHVATATDSGSPAPGVDGSAVTPSEDAGGPDAPDDTGGASPHRNSTCTPSSQQTGTIINSTHGRLDGTLVYVLPVDGSGSCNGDSSHVHLQIEVSSLVYDVAVDIGSTGDDVGLYQEAIAVPSGTWAEGWHATDDLAYPTLGLTSTQFPTASPSAIASQVESLLQSTSKVSIFCTGYTQGNGCHDVHYKNGAGEDGAIVLDPTAATSPVLFFRFQGQTF